MTKDEIVHYFRIPECDNRVRLCISNIKLDARSSRFFSKFTVSVEIQVAAATYTWSVVEGTQRGAFWSYEDAEKLARGMYLALAKQGMEVLEGDNLLKAIQY